MYPIIYAILIHGHSFFSKFTLPYTCFMKCVSYLLDAVSQYVTFVRCSSKVFNNSDKKLVTRNTCCYR